MNAGKYFSSKERDGSQLLKESMQEMVKWPEGRSKSLEEETARSKKAGVIGKLSENFLAVLQSDNIKGKNHVCVAEQMFRLLT